MSKWIKFGLNSHLLRNDRKAYNEDLVVLNNLFCPVKQVLSGNIFLIDIWRIFGMFISSKLQSLKKFRIFLKYFIFQKNNFNFVRCNILAIKSRQFYTNSGNFTIFHKLVKFQTNRMSFACVI